MGSTNLMKSAGIIAIWSMLSKILGFLRETALASRFGATSATDAYLVAMIIPSLFLLGIGPAVALSLIHIYGRNQNLQRFIQLAGRSGNILLNNVK